MGASSLWRSGARVGHGLIDQNLDRRERPIAPGLLGFPQGAFGLLDQAFIAFSQFLLRFGYGDSSANGDHAEFGSRMRNGQCCDGLSCAVGQTFGLYAVSQGHDGNKFLATMTAKQVSLFAALLLQRLCHLAEHGIPGSMAMRVVEAVKVVHVVEY